MTCLLLFTSTQITPTYNKFKIQQTQWLNPNPGLGIRQIWITTPTGSIYLFNPDGDDNVIMWINQQELEENIGDNGVVFIVGPTFEAEFEINLPEP